MDARIIGILELLRHKDVRVFRRHPAHQLHRAFDAGARRRQDQFRAQSANQLLALFAHIFRHHNPHPVAFQLPDQRYPNAGIP